MARPSNTAQRRLQMAEALLDIMADEGFEGASVARIAARAGLNQGLVYYHFKSKEEVLLAALDLLAHRHYERLDAALAAAPGAPRARGGAYRAAPHGRPPAADSRALRCWIDVSSEALRRPAVQAPFRDVLAALAGRLEAIIADGVAAGAFRADPAAAAAALLATIQGYLLVAGPARELIPYGSAARSAMAMARGLLAPPEPEEDR